MTEITDEQRAAYREVERIRDMPSFAAAWESVKVLLPAELTAPQPELPTEPGFYASGQEPDVAFRLEENGCWWYGADMWVKAEVEDHVPLTPLVPERPLISRDKALAAYEDATGGCGYVAGVDAILALVNGTD